MSIQTNCKIFLALAVSLGMFGARPASAQLPPEFQALQRPVPSGDLQKFLSDMTTLVRVAAAMRPNNPAAQTRAAQLQQRLANLTPEQLTVMANAYDRAGLSQAIANLSSLVPEAGATPPLASAGPSTAAAVIPVATYPIDASSSNTGLVSAPYGVCAPGATASYYFIGPPIPSNTSLQYGLWDVIGYLTAAQLILDHLCGTVVEILGEGTNLVACIIAMVAAEVLYHVEDDYQANAWCDSNVLSAENDATYSNTIAIFNNLAIAKNDIDLGFAATDTQISTVNSSLTNAGLVLSSNIYQAQTALDTHLSKVDGDVTAGTAQVDTNIATLQALALRIEIERSLASGINVGLFETPQAQGGYLELVGTTVQTVINGLVAAGQNVGNAPQYMNLGNGQFAAGQYKAAYSYYRQAYQAAVR